MVTMTDDTRNTRPNMKGISTARYRGDHRVAS